MDWRNRKYYVACFPNESFDLCLRTLKLIDSVTIHTPTQYAVKHCFDIICDEIEPRGYYQFLIGCSYDIADCVEYELRKAERRDGKSASWKEIKQKPKPYSPYRGFPERRCDLHPSKRCTHCMDC